MTRECAADFKRIKRYIDDYSISENLKEERYIASLKKIHKCYFTAVTWNAELMHNKDRFKKANINLSDDIVYRLTETVSDIGSSFFNWSNGNYKASRVMLRVAIENFIRGISGIERSDQLIEKNVFKLFEVASALNIFSSNVVVNKCYISLHSDYKLLCEDAHTASLQNMAHLSSLADLPAFEEKKWLFDVLSGILSKTCVSISKNTYMRKKHGRQRDIASWVGHSVTLEIGESALGY